MPGIDRDRVGRSFHRHAGEYDRHAVVQKRVVDRFLELLAGGPAPRDLLDVGTGTGLLLERLAARYPAARLTGVDLAPAMAAAAAERLAGHGVRTLAADAERLPFNAGSFDLVVSTSTFQWLDSLDRAFGEARRVLVPGGRFRFALFGGETLHELKDAWRRALAAHGGGIDRTHRCMTADEVLAALRRCGFTACGVRTERETEYHADARAVLRAIKRVGAGNAAVGAAGGLAGRRVTQEMLANYDRDHGAAGRVPATYEVIYGWGENPG